MAPKHEPGDTTEDAGRRDPRAVTEEADWRGPAPKERDRASDPHEQAEPCEDHDPRELIDEVDADDGSREAG
jgi:hypothetical protein